MGKPLTAQRRTNATVDWPQVTGPYYFQQQVAEIYNAGLVMALKRINNDVFDNELPDCQ